jgi:hypothetical protein
MRSGDILNLVICTASIKCPDGLFGQVGRSAREVHPGSSWCCKPEYFGHEVPSLHFARLIEIIMNYQISIKLLMRKVRGSEEGFAPLPWRSSLHAALEDDFPMPSDADHGSMGSHASSMQSPSQVRLDRASYTQDHEPVSLPERQPARFPGSPSRYRANFCRHAMLKSAPGARMPSEGISDEYHECRGRRRWRRPRALHVWLAHSSTRMSFILTRSVSDDSGSGCLAYASGWYQVCATQSLSALEGESSRGSHPCDRPAGHQRPPSRRPPTGREPDVRRP